MRHADWMAAAEEEYARLLVVLRHLTDDEWRLPTVCEGWDVRAMVAHLVGAAEATASLREMRRQQQLGRLRMPGAPDVDGINAVQVAEREQATPDQLVTALEDASRRGVRRRRRLPAPVRAIPVPFGPPLGVRSVGYLMDRIYTRDAWLHRMDIAAATGREPLLTPVHDGRIVADVVAEWMGEHDEPFRLTLTGPAGGSWARGGAGEELTLDAVDFCRTLSGRLPGTGLLAHPVPF